MLPLFTALSLSDCQRLSYAVPGNVTIADAAFEDCRYAGSGGALFLSSASISGAVAACSFLRCVVTSGYGGAVFFHGGGLRIDRCWFSGSESPSDGACVRAGWATAAPERGWDFADTATLRSLSHANNWWMTSGARPDISFARANFSANSLGSWGLAVTVTDGRTVRFRFIDIRANVGPNCMLLAPVENLSMRCISVRGNRCIFVAGLKYPGVFNIQMNVSLFDSVIAGNNATYLVGGVGRRYAMTFVNCHFDALGFGVTSGAEAQTAGCAADGGNMEVPSVCGVWWPRASSADPTTVPATTPWKLETTSQSRSGGPNAALIGGLTVVGIAVLGGVAGLAFFLVIRRKGGSKELEFELDSKGSELLEVECMSHSGFGLKLGSHST
jgi:hypothetical protein